MQKASVLKHQFQRELSNPNRQMCKNFHKTAHQNLLSTPEKLTKSLIHVQNELPMHNTKPFSSQNVS